MEQSSNSAFLEDDLEERKSHLASSQGGEDYQQRKSHAREGSVEQHQSEGSSALQKGASEASSLAMQRKQPNLADFPPPPIESTVQ